MRTTIPTGALALVAAAVLVSGCGAAASSPEPPDRPGAEASPAPSTAPSTAPSPAPSPAPSTDPSRATARAVYVAVGASETVGVGADRPGREAWPTVLHETALADWDYLNLGVSGSTVAEAISRQLPEALAAEPRLVTVWLNVNDITAQVPPTVYEELLGSLVHQLRRGGETEVVLANTPAVEQLPAYRACLPSAKRGGPACALPVVPPPRLVRQVVREYNAAIDRVARVEGATVVDLNAESGRRSLVTMTGADGFHPSTRGHRAVAGAFAAVIERVERRDR